MVAIGTEAFEDLLAGMHVVDVATAERPTRDNAAILLALLDVWNRSVLGRTSRAVIPYAHRLRLLPAHLQQLSMESLGKGVAADGGPVAIPTGSVLWGSSGTDAQHTFFQLLHQGSDVIPVDLVGVARPAVGATGSGEGWDDPRHGHDLLVANLAAQADALAFGRTAAEARATGVAEGLVPHRTFDGDRPSTIVLAPELTASTLGQLVSLAENRTVATGALLGVNPFDQWGVELGKELAAGLADDLATGRVGETEPEVIARYRALRDEQAG
jgi:glucose-6-phosphate isomerase